MGGGVKFLFSITCVCSTNIFLGFKFYVWKLFTRICNVCENCFSSIPFTFKQNWLFSFMLEVCLRRFTLQAVHLKFCAFFSLYFKKKVSVQSPRIVSTKYFVASYFRDAQSSFYVLRGIYRCTFLSICAVFTKCTE